MSNGEEDSNYLLQINNKSENSKNHIETENAEKNLENEPNDKKEKNPETDKGQLIQPDNNGDSIIEEQPDNKSSRQRATQSHVFGMLLAALGGFLSTVLILLAQVAIQYSLPNRLPSFEIVFFRLVIPLVLSVPMVARDYSHYDYPSLNKLILLVMAVSGFGFSMFGVLSAMYIPVADSFVITFTSPFLCCVTSYFILQETIDWCDGVCGVISFIGVVLVARPSFIFGADVVADKTVLFEDNLEHADKELRYLLGALHALLAGVSIAVYYPITRLLKGKINPFAAVFVPSLFGTIMCPALAFALGEMPIVPTLVSGMAMLGMGVFGFIASWFIVMALKLENATIINLIRNLDVAHAFVLQYIVFNIKPVSWSIAGALCIVGTTFIIVFRRWDKGRREKRAAREQHVD